MEFCTQYDSILGMLLLTSDGLSLTGLWMRSQYPPNELLRQDDLPVFAQTKDWLDRYFHGGSPSPAELPLKAEGTAFRKAVWEILLTIPYGKTTTYGAIAKEMAQKMGKSRMSAQAVGGAVGANPIGIIIPCHRVVGSSGQLTGYAGGMENKCKLLQLEGWQIDEEKLLIVSADT